MSDRPTKNGAGVCGLFVGMMYVSILSDEIIVALVSVLSAFSVIDKFFCPSQSMNLDRVGPVPVLIRIRMGPKVCRCLSVLMFNQL